MPEDKDKAGQDEVGDFVCIATGSTPTEAHLMKEVLAVAGLQSHVRDAHLVQAYHWLTPAMGGVRVVVPASQAGAARDVLARFQAGAFRLEGEPDEAVAPSEVLRTPVFSLDLALVLSLMFTPVFLLGIHGMNASRLGPEARWRGADRLWFLVLLAFTGMAVFIAHGLQPGWLVLFQASVLMWWGTMLWYLLVGQKQSRHLIARHGLRYGRRSLLGPALLTGAGLLGAGIVLAELA